MYILIDILFVFLLSIWYAILFFMLFPIQFAIFFATTICMLFLNTGPALGRKTHYRAMPCSFSSHSDFSERLWKN